MKIAVFGLGYVGVVNIACLTKLGHQIKGVDIKVAKVEAINEGRSPLYEPGVDELISSGVKEGKVSATANASEAISGSDMAIVCVGTPSNPDGEVDLSYTRNTVQDIAREVMRSNNHGFCIVLRSTIPPSTIRTLVLPMLKDELGPKFEELGIQVAFIPEFLREGSAVKDFFEGRRIVVGTENKQHIPQIDQVFGFSDQTPLVYVDFDTAEFVKYVDNTFHALKVAFANEVYSIGEAFGVDVASANEIFLMDDSLNISKRYLRPGAPFGGSCLPKDLRAVEAMAKKVEENIPLLNGITQANNTHKERFLNRIRDFVDPKDRILLYGMTFKSNTDDTRESPFIELAERLTELNYNLSIVDPDLDEISFRLNHPGLYKNWSGNTVDEWDFDKIIVFKKVIGGIPKNQEQNTMVLN